MKLGDLKFCGKCPFLLSAALHDDIFAHPRYNSDLSNTVKWTKLKGQGNHTRIRNQCAVSEYYFGKEGLPGDLGYELLDQGLNPKRKKGCLVLAKHILSQYTKE